MTRRLLILVVAGTITLALSAGVVRSAPARAAGTITFDGSPGTGAPPPKLGSYTMKPFGADPRPLNTSVSGVTVPSGHGTVGFTPALEHLQVGNGWNTWSNGYTGDVYYTGGGASMTFTLPAGTDAFYFYAEPNPYATFEITATAQNGTTSGPIPVNGFASARYFGFYTDGSIALKSIQVDSQVDFAVGEFGISSSVNYVAFGDSYSSGEGAPPFFAGTDGPSDFCHRSVNAYSQVLGQAYGTDPKFYACSGAVTANITGQYRFGEPPQITQPGVDSTASLVTMSIGGNDAGFGDVLTSCVEQKLKADAINAAIGATAGPVALWLGLGADPSCANSQSFVDAANSRISNVYGPALSTYQALLGATSPTDTSIIIADYPHLFPDSQSEQTCLALSTILTTQDEQYFNGAADRLDGVLQGAAAQAGVNFVDVRSAFGGHAICGGGGAWINGISLASGSGQSCTLEVLGKCIWSGAPIVGSFHPNAGGQSGGYAAAIQAYISAAANQTPEGFPLNPNQGADPAVLTTAPSASVGTLNVSPVTQGTADCAGTYQAGQSLTVTGGGFAPGATVRFYISSPGLGATPEQQVASVTADSNGNVSVTFRIPLAATGFTPAGASAGLVFVDAIGSGTGGTHVDDVASAGLAPHTSSCGTVEPYPFTGFDPPVANPPAINQENAGRTIPVKFSLTGSGAVLSQVLAAGYPQSASVSCTAPDQLTSGDPATAASSAAGSPNDDYNYLWQTDASWTGCRELIVKLVDGTYHRAIFNFR